MSEEESDFERGDLEGAIQESMQTSEEVLADFLGFIGNRACEACGINKWFPLGRDLVLWPIAHEENSSVPLKVFMCGNCGNTRTFPWSRISFYLKSERNYGKE